MKRFIAQLASPLRVACLTLCVLFSLAVISHAQTPSETNAASQTRGEDDLRSRQLFRILNLTPEQQAEIRHISRQSADERRELQQRAQAARRALDEAIHSGTADDATIDLRAREAAEAQAAFVRMRARTEYRIRRVLTPQQLQTLRELRARFPNRPNARRGERRGLRGQRRPRRGMRQTPGQN